MNKVVMRRKVVCFLVTLLLLCCSLNVSADNIVPTVTPTESKQILFLDFDKETDTDYFWSNDSTAFTVTDGALSITGTGLNWGLLFASDDNYLSLEPDMDYTVMLKYKTHPDTPQYQFVVNGTQNGSGISDYCYRWGTGDFKNYWSYQRDPLTGTVCNWYGDFQHLEDGDYDIVSFHFYTAPGSSELYFSLATCGTQAPNPLDFTLESFSLFEGYAELSNPADTLSESFKDQMAAETIATTSVVTTTTTAVNTTHTLDDNIAPGHDSGFGGWIICAVIMVCVCLLLVIVYLLFIRSRR